MLAAIGIVLMSVALAPTSPINAQRRDPERNRVLQGVLVFIGLGCLIRACTAFVTMGFDPTPSVPTNLRAAQGFPAPTHLY